MVAPVSVSRLVPLILALAAPSSPSAAQEVPDGASTAELETFEREVRPLLLSRCSRCHGPDEQESGLRVDHIDFLLRGGSRGPALSRGDPAASRMLRAVFYTDPDLQMPPKSRLPASEVEILRRWIASGAAWPDEPLPEAAGGEPAFDLHERRREHGAWQPLADPTPPEVTGGDWCLDPMDRFVLARLEERGMRPGPDAEKAAWLRRVTFDLTGLPPSPGEVEAFLGDGDEGAYARVADRLLASPHFGERWARHWLDLVRYAETMGHEYDFEIPNAWRYRDYVIRAFNADVPYDEFAIEHIAGDLLEEPRRDPETGDNESILATGSFWFCEQTHSPVDVYHHLADRVDNQLDVMGKTFLGLTVGCARCHDHKFDAISTADYYSMFGFLDSSRYAQVQVSPPVRGTPTGRAMHEAMTASAEAATRSLRASAAALQSEILAALALRARGTEAATPEELRAAASAEGVCEERLRSWLDFFGDAGLARDPGHPLHALVVVAAAPESGRAEAWNGLVEGRTGPGATSRDGPARELVDFSRVSPSSWFADGDAFGPVSHGASHGGGLVLPDAGGQPRLVHLPGEWAHSGGLGARRQGVLHSPSFELELDFVHVRVAGRGSRVNLVNEGFHLIRNPIYGGLKHLVDDERPHWITFRTGMWKGHRAWLTCIDQSTPDLADPEREDGYPEDAWLAVQRVVLSDDERPPEVLRCWPVELLGREPVASLEELAERYGDALERALDNPDDAAHAEYLAFLQQHDLIAPPSGEAFERAWETLCRLDAAPVRTAPGTVDGSGVDRYVFVRGNPHEPGAPTPRRFLEALDGSVPLAIPAGSGRLQLARRMFAQDNPFPARVMVNRIWHHLTGRGIVATVDNLGHLGERPTHPELLDWLACRFVDEDWSIKSMIRRIVLSRTYRMTSRPQPEFEERDPDVLWLHRMRVRRLEAEAIRDSVLAVCGGLDRTLHGPPVPIHLTRFMTGRGRPDESGPLDGGGRRSIYQEVRRNFLPPTMRAFDLPTPFGTVGRRGRSNVPAQALAMRNDRFVVEQCEAWARRVVADVDGEAERVRAMYLAAFARPPAGDESAAALAFVRGQTRSNPPENGDPGPWSDLGHVLLNLPEFLFLP